MRFCVVHSNTRWYAYYLCNRFLRLYCNAWSPWCGHTKFSQEIISSACAPVAANWCSIPHFPNITISKMLLPIFPPWNPKQPPTDCQHLIITSRSRLLSKENRFGKHDLLCNLQNPSSEPSCKITGSAQVFLTSCRTSHPPATLFWDHVRFHGSRHHQRSLQK